MKRKIISVFSVVLALEILLVIAMGVAVLVHYLASPGAQAETGGGDDMSHIDTEEPPEAVEGEYLVREGASDYRIVIPAENAFELAATELQSFLEQASGVRIPIVVEGEQGNAPFISVGETEALKNSGIDYSAATLGSTGIVMYTQGRNIFLAGAEDYGTLNAVYEFLHDVVGYEAYAPDEIALSQSDTVPLYKLETTYRPSLEMMSTSAGLVYQAQYIQGAARMRLIAGQSGGTSIKGHLFNGQWCHTTLQLLPESEYSDRPWYSNGQICLTNEDLIAEMAEVVAGILENSAMPYLMIGNMDRASNCTLESKEVESCSCLTDSAAYGGQGGVYVRFLNKVAEQVAEILGPDKDFMLVGLAYYNYLGAPVDANGTPVDPSVVCNEHVGMMVVDMGNCFGHSFYDTSCSTAQQYAMHYRNWANLTDCLMAYTYGTNFSNYVVPFNDFNVYAENLKFFSEIGCKYVFDQCAGANEMTGFIPLKTYIKSKTAWDVSDYEKNYAALENNFFVAYYKDAASAMYGYYNAVRSHYALLQHVNGDTHVNMYDNGLSYAGETSWSLQKIDELQTYIDRAYAAVENAAMTDAQKEILNRRIMAEEITLRYLRLTYWNDYMSSGEFVREWNGFVDDAIYCGTQYASEGNEWEKR